MRKKKSKSSYSLFSFAIGIIFLVVMAISNSVPNAKIDIDSGNNANISQVELDENIAKVHFIDVGQGDCTLIQGNGYNMLIDTGDSDCASDVSKYLINNGVKKIDVAVATHMDKDHIGGFTAISDEIEFDTIFYFAEDKDTKVYKNFLEFINGKNTLEPKIGDIYQLGDLEYCFLAPNDLTDNTGSNDYSIVTKVTYGDTSFLFMADADIKEEKEIIENVPSSIISSTVLKVAHHGSKYSTSTDFLDVVSPKYSVISVGKDNQYGHPHNDLLKRLSEKNIDIYRTDMDGTIVFLTDGKNVKVQE